MQSASKVIVEDVSLASDLNDKATTSVTIISDVACEDIPLSRSNCIDRNFKSLKDPTDEHEGDDELEESFPLSKKPRRPAKKKRAPPAASLIESKDAVVPKRAKILKRKLPASLLESSSDWYSFKFQGSPNFLIVYKPTGWLFMNIALHSLFLESNLY